MSTRVGSVTGPGGHVAFEIWVSRGGVEITPHMVGVVLIDSVQARAFAALLEVATVECRRMRKEFTESTVTKAIEG